MTGALASHYARALADAVFAPHSGLSPEDATAQLGAAEQLINGSKDLQRVLLSPAVKKDKKQAVITKLSEELGINRLIRNFLLVLVSHRRTGELDSMRREFEAVVDERSGWIPAKISSATELNAEQKEQIERALGAKLGKYIRAEYTIDPALLAGVRARVASRDYDATLRGRLENMRQRLAAQA